MGAKNFSCVSCVKTCRQGCSTYPSSPPTTTTPSTHFQPPQLLPSVPLPGAYHNTHRPEPIYRALVHLFHIKSSWLLHNLKVNSRLDVASWSRRAAQSHATQTHASPSTMSRLDYFPSKTIDSPSKASPTPTVCLGNQGVPVIDFFSHKTTVTPILLFSSIPPPTIMFISESVSVYTPNRLHIACTLVWKWTVLYDHNKKSLERS